jgi:undecaprenyl pyrophosphate phosphatase UppP
MSHAQQVAWIAPGARRSAAAASGGVTMVAAAVAANPIVFITSLITGIQVIIYIYDLEQTARLYVLRNT